jgi:glucose-6-phosphate isomerase
MRIGGLKPMLKLELADAGVDPAAPAAHLKAYTDHLRSAIAGDNYPESSLRLPSDRDALATVTQLAGKLAGPKLKYNVVVGIGGSNLGTRAVYDALFGYADLLRPDRFPKLIFAETTDPEWLNATTELLNSLESGDEIIVTVVSKSGGTTETIANFEIIAESLKPKLGDITSRIVAITDHNSKLEQAAVSAGIACLNIPDMVGGRFSVLSPVGLFPLATAGVDIAQLLEGARSMRDACLGGDNPAAASAAVLSLQRERGLRINDNFFFHAELESLGKWYRQLMGESVGKERSIQGKVVHAGITPTVSLGSTDLHSVGQLYLGGPKDKLTTFVSSAKSAHAIVPSERVFPNLVPMVTGKSAAQIMSAILEGTKIAYHEASLPFVEIVLDAIDEHSLGEFLQFKMLEMMYLAHLMNVNAFDQPSVESYKIETKRLLERA